ncbi:hypothetical protein B9Z19DRAFT_1094970 [Tuber borchii]|uniref:Uncharacterized protein n=1 Tax=Tuber borchii TaxID=42251 RepID=A0A2T6ZDC6_TUBBO|nr:hypothetical protein B9Z19DRAFT_1094970 [Tuber borchii]
MQSPSSRLLFHLPHVALITKALLGCLLLKIRLIENFIILWYHTTVARAVSSKRLREEDKILGPGLFGRGCGWLGGVFV